jgi:hypothetical protein
MLEHFDANNPIKSFMEIQVVDVSGQDLDFG